MCTQDVQLSTRGKQFGKTSECAHKRSNSQHGIGNLARLPNVHTRGPTLNTRLAICKDIRMCTQEVQLSTRVRQFVKNSECAYKRSNSQHGIGKLVKHPNMHIRGRTLSKNSEYPHKRSNSQHGIGKSARHPNVHTRGRTLHTVKAIWQDFRICTQEV
ncbi:hypothetical protein PoB_001077500 [Plakobranchus ocellatus]|uniref:Uncharacterized protein n=1 Tax=Plakobranchus ocellatus TaxID=259542 RepID=A0AAV3YNH7_9GAST|nr:hypothetical protein PoB_001077500 [Plakobranchus ocellatus]